MVVEAGCQAVRLRSGLTEARVAGPGGSDGGGGGWVSGRGGVGGGGRGGWGGGGGCGLGGGGGGALHLGGEHETVGALIQSRRRRPLAWQPVPVQICIERRWSARRSKAGGRICQV